MLTKAAILYEINKPLVIDTIKLPPLKDSQVLVKIAYSGICQGQLLEIKGFKGEDKYLPHCLGHEASGVVVEIGKGVTKVKANDKVALTWIKGVGLDGFGCVCECSGKKINAGPISTFSEYSIISENRLYKVKSDISMEEIALLGCAIPTGLGSVLNIAKPKKNQSIAVFGCGGIGLLAIQGAKISGCSSIVAIDLFDNKLQIAKKMGATHTINASKYSKEHLTELIKTELDFAIESSGSPKAMLHSLESIRPRGGTAVILGNTHHEDVIKINPKHFNLGKRILGSWGGECMPDQDYPFFEKLIEEKKLDLTFLTNDKYHLDDINQAIKDVEMGKATRALISFE
ncbi:MAG: Aryl-alcohol dehydrogenase [Candidatus Anoxychlamydiales bacterium]|nr:Aryl-alcohol dehydrogenase [Candidatus Anoxychlamydiales bacterium]